MARQKRQYGFTLIEVMLVVAIISVLAFVAIPLYQDYVRAARAGAGRGNLESLRIELESHWLDYQTYVSGSWASGSGSWSSSDFTWQPENPTTHGYSYVVTPGASGLTSSYSVTVIHSGSGSSTTFDKDSS